MVDNRHAILNNGDRASYQRYVESLPLIGLTRLFGYWIQESIDPSCVMAWRLRFRIGFYLNFVAPPQKDATVRFGSSVEFQVQPEIEEFRNTDDLRSVAGAD